MFAARAGLAAARDGRGRRRFDLMLRFHIYYLSLFILCCPESANPNPSDVRLSTPSVYNWEFFLHAGIELERNDFPDLALRSFGTSLLLLGENKTISSIETAKLKHLIKEWVQQTKARRLGAFKAVAAKIKIGNESTIVEWKVGYDIRQVGLREGPTSEQITSFTFYATLFV
jgi:hypothetical protein